MQIAINEQGQKIVVLPDVIFTNKQDINWAAVEEYLEKYVGTIVEISDSKDIVYIGKDFPDEYAGSKYTRTLKGARAKAKANAVQGIHEMIEIATDKRFKENYKAKHVSDAAKGWYYYTTRFAMPIFENEKKSENYNVFSACLVINHASNNKLYLYDIVDIKKEASNPLKTIKQPNGIKTAPLVENNIIT